MARKTVTERYAKGIDLCDFAGPVNSLIERLQEMQADAPGELYIDVDYYYDDVDLTFQYVREETDEEMRKREAKARKAAATRRKNAEARAAKEAEKVALAESEERELLAKLKAKYE